MANQYTSIATAGLSTNTVITAYDFAIDRVLRETPQYRAWVSKRPERPNGPGQSIVLNKYDWFDSTAVTAAKTPLNEEQDVDSTKLPATVPVTLTYNEYGFAVTTTNKLKLFSFADVDSYAVEALGNHRADWQDEMVQDVMVTGTTKLYGGGQTAEGNLTTAHVLTGAQIRQAVTKLRTNKVMPMDGQFYAAGIHPHAVFDLRIETGSNGWRVPNEYGQSQDRIWKGEVGAFEGARFVENTRTRRTQTGSGATNANSVYRTFVVGKQAIAEGVAVEPTTRFGPTVDKLGRFRTVGWYGVLGWVVYRNEALVQVLTGSSVSTL